MVKLTGPQRAALESVAKYGTPGDAPRRVRFFLASNGLAWAPNGGAWIMLPDGHAALDAAKK